LPIPAALLKVRRFGLIEVWLLMMTKENKDLDCKKTEVRGEERSYVMVKITGYQSKLVFKSGFP